MKKGIKLLILVLILAVAIVLVILLNKPQNETTAEPLENVIFSLSENGINSFSVVVGGFSIDFSKADGVWKCTDDELYPVDDNKIDSFLKALEKVCATKVIEDPEDISGYGLLEPTVMVYFPDNESVIAFGNQLSGTGDYYVSVNDDEKVYMVSESVFKALPAEGNGFVKFEDIPEMTGVTSFKITGQNADIEIVKKEDGYYMKQGAEFLPVDTEKTEDYMKNVTDMQFISCVDYNASDYAITSYYRLQYPYAQIEVVYDGGTFSIDVGTVNGLSLCARYPESNMVYEIDNDVIMETIYVTYDELKAE